MGDSTKIEWTRGEDGRQGATWNPVVGCSVASPGCDNCYAAREAAGRLRNVPAYAGLAVRAEGEPARFTGEVRCLPERLDQPLRWRRPRRIFVNSMSDLFHPQVPVSFIGRVFAVMALAPQHTFQVLTKRPQRMALVVGSDDFVAAVEIECRALLNADRRLEQVPWRWPLGNVWLGTSVEDQRNADMRIPHLLATPAAVRWLSCEPLLGPIRLPLTTICPCCEGDKVHERGEGGHGTAGGFGACERCYRDDGPQGTVPVLDWVVVGGESGHGARPMAPQWAGDLRDQCQAAGVPYLFKQWGEWAPGVMRDDWIGVANDDTLSVEDPELNVEPMTRVGKKAAGRLLDGREWNQYPGGRAR